MEARHLSLILGVIMTISLVIYYLLSSSSPLTLKPAPGSSSAQTFDLVREQTKMSNSQTYWLEEAKPCAIDDHDITRDGNITLYLENKDSKAALTMTNLKIGNASYATLVEIAPGEFDKVTFGGGPVGKKGELYDLPVAITYNDVDGNSRTQIGEKNITGRFT